MGRLDFISYLHLSKSNLISFNESTAPQIFLSGRILYKQILIIFTIDSIYWISFTNLDDLKKSTMDYLLRILAVILFKFEY